MSVPAPEFAAPGFPALEVRDLVAGYDPGLPIVNGASMTVRPGEFVTILGPNGAGKSTLIKAIAGLVRVTGGTVRLGGTEITGAPAHLMARHSLGFVPQTENIFALMTIDDNLRLAVGALPKAERGARMEAMYALFPDIADRRRLMAGRLSGGQRQMLAFARALAVSPSVLMLDEPSAGLSPKLVEQVFTKLADVRRTGVTILLVEQNARAALAVADRGVILVEGRERHEGPAAHLLDDPAVAELYLGGRRRAEGIGA
ncbi:amino acid/amide ABC transporter ATP-binding protein 2, HAAT family [Faunimonas pinastri]|uniref:Amino acid/amide ABC transporter ATP-binding protein 2, HAAT family n=1 Tax=Faunimonas pinastri TaxID=1855383 RepID=A0A1H9BYU8_9HYPH|nr:ABC transporter ATP-binding protein [Faunimonas pinastri]SEP94034.1 amino acid/amide ABC transporter ATP-binding protein 2, HAAT family [Faunimonas pinastri]